MQHLTTWPSAGATGGGAGAAGAAGAAAAVAKRYGRRMAGDGQWTTERLR